MNLNECSMNLNECSINLNEYSMNLNEYSMNLFYKICHYSCQRRHRNRFHLNN